MSDLTLLTMNKIETMLVTICFDHKSDNLISKLIQPLIFPYLDFPRFCSLICRCDSLQRLSLGVRRVALTALFVATPIVQLLNINKCDSLTVDNYCCFQLNKFV